MWVLPRFFHQNFRQKFHVRGTSTTRPEVKLWGLMGPWRAFLLVKFGFLAVRSRLISAENRHKNTNLGPFPCSAPAPSHKHVFACFCDFRVFRNLPDDSVTFVAFRGDGARGSAGEAPSPASRPGPGPGPPPPPEKKKHARQKKKHA